MGKLEYPRVMYERINPTKEKSSWYLVKWVSISEVLNMTFYQLEIDMKITWKKVESIKGAAHSLVMR